MKNLLLVFTLATIATVAYFNSNGSCAFAGKPDSAAADASAKPTEISMDAQKGVPEGWVTDFEGALKQAKAENKAVLIDFTGSDWCGWCIKLDKEVFSQPAFEKYAQQNLVRVYLDFPNKKAQSTKLEQQNRELAEKFQVQGFPTIFVLNSDGEPIAKLGYQRGGAEKYVDTLKEAISEKEQS